MKIPCSSKPATPARRALTAALLLLPLALPFAPFARAVPINDGDLIPVSGTADTGDLSTITFNGSGTFLIANNTNLVYDSGGAATQRLSVPASRSVTFVLGNSATMKFSGNNNSADGAAILLNAANARLTLTAPNGGLFLFDSNTTQGRGAALAVTNATASATIDHAVFSNNINNTTVTTNHAAAMILANGATATLTDALFISNTAAYNGGAIMINNNNTVLNLTDVSFINNTAKGTGNQGGAILFNNAASATMTLNYNISTGKSSQLAGNKIGNGNLNSMTFNGVAAGLAQNLNVNIAAGGSLDMLDPMAATGNTTITISQTGSGVWNLGGASTLGNNTAGSSVNFTVNSGTLHLYRAGEISTVTPINGIVNTATATAGRLTLNVPAGTFALAANATLSSGGGNLIQAPAINLAPGATLAFDLANITSGTMLTLNATTFTVGNWAQTLSLTGLSTSLATSATINLISLAGAGAAANPFLATSFGAGGLAAINATLPAGYLLDISNPMNLLLLYTVTLDTNNYVLTWAAAAGNSNWSAPNWLRPASTTGTNFKTGDIINLADTTPPPSTTTLTLDTNATTAAIYVNGAADYTITGTGSLRATATAGAYDPATAHAATGQLILGAAPTPDATGTTTTPYNATLTLANTGTNNFENGITINTGQLIGNTRTLNVGGASSSPTTGITIAPTGTLTISQTTNATYATPIAGSGHLNKTAPGALTLTANNTNFTGLTDILAGKLLLANAALGGNITVHPAATLGGTGTLTTPGQTPPPPPPPPPPSAAPAPSPPPAKPSPSPAPPPPPPPSKSAPPPPTPPPPPSPSPSPAPSPSAPTASSTSTPPAKTTNSTSPASSPKPAPPSSTSPPSPPAPTPSSTPPPAGASPAAPSTPPSSASTPTTPSLPPPTTPSPPTPAGSGSTSSASK